MNKNDMFSSYPPHEDIAAIDELLAQELKKCDKKIVVLDDDPTGIQTVHGVSVYTDWSAESINRGFQEENRLFFILTNSRAFSQQRTREVHRAIGELLAKQEKDFILISRGDSTLRGHFPLETEVLRESIEAGSETHFDGEIIYPFFPEGGRYTIDDIHYVEIGGELIPAGETEFAKDKTFPYGASSLPDFIEEKTRGEYPANRVISISLEELRMEDYSGIEEKLLAAKEFEKIIVNSISYEDVKVFAVAYYRAIARGKRFLFRSAAAVVKILGGITDKPLLSKEEFAPYLNDHGGLVIVGSHVQKTTKQLEWLNTDGDIEFITINQHLALDPKAFSAEIDRVIEEVERELKKGKTTVVFTRRDRFDLGSTNPEDELRLATEISDKVTSIVTRLSVRPSFLIAKGGITSSSIGTEGLGVKKVRVMGQILPGVPVWLTDASSKFSEIPYVIFPGNVGEEYSLLEAINTLRK